MQSRSLRLAVPYLWAHCVVGGPELPRILHSGSTNTEPGAVATGSGLRYRLSAMAESCDDNIPLAYLITFRAHGTWLHGDRRGSVDRFHNRYGTPRIPPN